MNIYKGGLSAALLVLILGTSPSQFAQGRPNQQDHALALGLLRTINTAEATDFAEGGSYVSWDTLREKHLKYLDEWLATYYSHESSLHFAALPQVLPGWQVRLNVHPDGKGTMSEYATLREVHSTLLCPTKAVLSGKPNHFIESTQRRTLPRDCS